MKKGGAIPQYKVPQKIDLPDRIIGPLTLIQFGYLLIGGMIAFTIFKTGSIVLIILVAAPIVLLALALAFVKVQNQPFGKFIFNLISFGLSPKTRVWHHGKTSIPTQLKSATSQTNKSTRKVTKKILNKNQLKQISRQSDRKI